ncbi:lasso peptide biosynthesis B2 protein [Erythrobacter sp. MTPC3]|uniref:lasso peptide biosynthesis B2 protein n=1 Tax=Erythrobacter sp. MTPC3 TaxID=3056564 RepID=UPI0036F2E506
MSSPAESDASAPSLEPTASDLAWIAAYSVIALAELVRARWTFRTFDAKDILPRNDAARSLSSASPPANRASKIARIAYVMPRVARRLPFKSDCLIQAIAAQDWLSRLGMASAMQIGVQKPDTKPFEAHAWLLCGETVVTGGEIAHYEVLLDGTPKTPSAGGNAVNP